MNAVAPRSRTRLAAGLTGSLLVHGLIAVGVAAWLGSASRAPDRIQAPIAARLVAPPRPLPPSTSPPPVTASRTAEAAAPREPGKSPPRRLPTPLTKPTPPPPIQQVIVTTNVDDGAPDEALAPIVEAELSHLVRIALHFEEPPRFDVPVEALRGVEQWRVRGLLRVSDGGVVQLVHATNYDERLLQAIREALKAARARSPEPGTEAWAIVDFWFEVTGDIAR